MNPVLQKFKIFSSVLSRFQLANALLFVSIYLFVFLMVLYNLYLIVDLNSGYSYALNKRYASTGLNKQFTDSFFEYLIGHSMNNLVPVSIVTIVIFFLGVYISNVLIRPFKLISDFCEKSLKNPQIIYGPSWIGGHNFFTRFSELFFSQINLQKVVNGKTDAFLPRYYGKIHQPTTDWIFVMHFTLVMCVLSAVSTYSIIRFNDALYESLVDFMINYSRIDSQATIELLKYQSKLLYGMFFPIFFISTLLNFILAIFMYSKVSSAAFGVFSTMRAFMKGSYHSRVHLIGHGVLREYTRNLNKYLERIESQIKSQLDSQVKNSD